MLSTGVTTKETMFSEVTSMSTGVLSVQLVRAVKTRQGYGNRNWQVVVSLECKHSPHLSNRVMQHSYRLEIRYNLPVISNDGHLTMYRGKDLDSSAAARASTCPYSHLLHR
jgi:hypothetical protein